MFLRPGIAAWSCRCLTRPAPSVRALSARCCLNPYTSGETLMRFCTTAGGVPATTGTSLRLSAAASAAFLLHPAQRVISARPWVLALSLSPQAHKDAQFLGCYCSGATCTATSAWCHADRHTRRIAPSSCYKRPRRQPQHLPSIKTFA
jgi:hypothetical protein